MHALIELNLRRNQLTSAEGLQALPALPLALAPARAAELEKASHEAQAAHGEADVEHEKHLKGMDAELAKLKASGRVHRVSGECHATTGLSGAQKASCLRVLRSVECPPDRITPYMTCERAAQDTADRSHVTSRDARVGGSAPRG